MLAEKRSRSAPVGHQRPRIAPPIPARSKVAEFTATAKGIGIDLMPWQRTAARYITALGPNDRWLYREVAIVVARQNGKSTLLVPLIVGLLREGKRIIHTAQNRELPREIFGQVADVLADDETLFPERNGRRTRPRFANGQEEVRLANGGLYRIVAPTRGGARGHAGVDLVIIDELREMDTFDFVAAAKPTTTTSPNPQILYLSNAGEDDSVVLNALRDRSGKDPALAYLEWSAAPERASDDIAGWREANPAIGHLSAVLDALEAEYRAAKLSGTMPLFEVEHLCRWVKTTREPLVQPAAWGLCEAPELPRPRRPYLGLAADPAGKRVSAVLAWQRTDGSIAMRQVFEGTGDPVNLGQVVNEVRDLVAKHRAMKVGFDPMTDGELAKVLRNGEAMSGAKAAVAASKFVNLVETRRLTWTDAAAVTEDLTWTARKETDETGVYHAVRANDDRPITAALAAIRAVGLADLHRISRPRIY